MQIKWVPNGTLCMYISHRELAGWGVTFEEMQEGDARTDKAVRRLLAAACKQVGVQTGGVTVEAVPVDGGCVMVATPRQTLSVHIFQLATADAVMQLGGVHIDSVEASSLYAYAGAWYLVVFAPHMRVFEYITLCEYGERVTGDRHLAAYLAEHAQAVYIGDALERLYVAGKGDGVSGTK